MLKQHEKSFSLLQKISDFFTVIFVWFLAFYFRFYLAPDGEQGLGPLFIKLSPLIALLTLFFFHRNGLYRSQRFNSRWKEISTVLTANTQAILCFVIILYFFAPNRLSRIMLISYFVISQITLVSLRLFVRNYLRYLRRQGKNLRHVLLVGDGKQLENYVDHIKQFKDAGVEFLGWKDSLGKAESKKILSLDEDLETIKSLYRIDAIVVGFSAREAYKVDAILKNHYNDIIPIQVLPDLTYSFIGHEIEDFAGIPLITINQPHFDSLDMLLKRLFDLVLTAPSLILISPLMLLLALGVKFSSKGPIFYGQERMSLDGKSFLMWKFRSMKTDAEKDQTPGWTVENDPRKTKFGNFLRKTSLDELPQIWNVFKGDMSLVGPRPERPYFVHQFKNQIPAYMLRHKMKTGITGWAQVNGWRGDTSLEKRIECDIYYIKNWSLWFDIKILFLTFWKGFINKNAY